MSKKKKKELPQYPEIVRLFGKAGIGGYKAPSHTVDNIDDIEELGERIEKILGIIKNFRNKTERMLFFVMYDIENNKVRTKVAKYLEKKGCIRIQKSIFLADLERKTFTEIHNTLRDVQAMYDNFDSILIVPVSTDELRAMKIIGQNLDFDVVINSQNTLFF